MTSTRARLLVWSFNLDAEQIEVLVRQLSPTMKRTFQELLVFAGFLEKLADDA